jgi:hypothetical protein
MKNKTTILILFLLIILLVIILKYNNIIIEKFNNNNYDSIPFVLIVYNNLYFLKNFINQIKKYPNPIIILDNKSTYKPINDYYKELKNELGDKIDIRLLDKNYGHLVYIHLKSELPKIFILSDIDLELNINMPINFIEILHDLSIKYNAGKVGLALNIEDKELFIKGFDEEICNHEIQFWNDKIPNNELEVYNAKIDTTFCLINSTYSIGNSGLDGNHIRVAGNFTAKHLPWYNNYLKKKIPLEELTFWLENNISSSILNNKYVKQHLNI